MNLLERALTYWSIYFFVTFIFLESILGWCYYNLKNKNHNFKLSKKIYIGFSWILSIMHVVTYLFFTRLTSPSINILCVMIFSTYNICLAKTIKPTPHKKSIFCAFTTAIIIIELSINLVAIDLFCKTNSVDSINDENFFTKFHLFVFVSQLGVVLSLCNTLYYFLHVFYLKEYSHFILLSMVVVDNMTDECPICLEELKTKKSVKTSCNHAYHEECMKVSLETSLKCPMCRKEFQYTYCF
jgi:hypothetical protein